MNSRLRKAFTFDPEFELYPSFVNVQTLPHRVLPEMVAGTIEKNLHQPTGNLALVPKLSEGLESLPGGVLYQILGAVALSHETASGGVERVQVGDQGTINYLSLALTWPQLERQDLQSKFAPSILMTRQFLAFIPKEHLALCISPNASQQGAPRSAAQPRLARSILPSQTIPS